MTRIVSAGLVAALVAAGVLVGIGVAPRRAQTAVASSALTLWVSDVTRMHAAALAATADHLAALEARPVEVADRALRELTAHFPALADVAVVDAAGRVTAGIGTFNAGDVDANAGRRVALAAPGSSYAHIEGAGDARHLAMGVRVGEVRVVAELRTQILSTSLTEVTSGSGLTATLATDGVGGLAGGLPVVVSAPRRWPWLLGGLGMLMSVLAALWVLGDRSRRGTIEARP